MSIVVKWAGRGSQRSEGKVTTVDGKRVRSWPRLTIQRTGFSEVRWHITIRWPVSYRTDLPELPASEKTWNERTIARTKAEELLASARSAIEAYLNGLATERKQKEDEQTQAELEYEAQWEKRAKVVAQIQGLAPTLLGADCDRGEAIDPPFVIVDVNKLLAALGKEP